MATGNDTQAAQTPQENIVVAASNKIAPYATLLGLVNDSIGIISILFSVITLASTLLFIDRKPTFIFTNVAITLYHLLGLWIVTAYIFYGLTRKAYLAKQEPKPVYWQYLLLNLARDFENPSLPIFGAIMIALLIWILISFDVNSLIIIGGVVIALMVAVGALIDWYNNETNTEERKFKKLVGEDWSICERVISERLAESKILRQNDLYDFTKAQGINEYRVDYLYAKFASTYPRRAKYGYIYQNKDGKSEPLFYTTNWRNRIFPIKALISVRHLNENKGRLDFNV